MPQAFSAVFTRRAHRRAEARQVIGRHAYTSHRPVAGSSAGHAASSAKVFEPCLVFAESPSAPDFRSPGKLAPYSASQVRERRSISAASAELKRAIQSLPREGARRRAR